MAEGQVEGGLGLPSMESILAESEQFIPTGPCNEVQMRHAQGIAASLAGIRELAAAVKALKERGTNDKDTICQKVDELRKEVKGMMDKVNLDSSTNAALAADVRHLTKDIDEVAKMLRAHIDKHPDLDELNAHLEHHPTCNDIAVMKTKVDEHLAWHKAEDEKDKQFWEKYFKGPLAQLILYGLVALVLLGFVAWYQKQATTIAVENAVKAVMAQQRALDLPARIPAPSSPNTNPSSHGHGDAGDIHP